MNKETLINLFKAKDAKRKKALVQIFSNVLFMDASLKFICTKLNQELGEEFLTIDDIKYCRRQFKKVSANQHPIRVSEITHKLKTDQVQSLEEITWTNPDEKIIENNLKSKFTKS